jgi:hypothetical protein
MDVKGTTLDGVNGTQATNDTSTKKLAKEGSLTSYQTLYQGPKDNDEKWTWLDKEPADVPEAAENDETAQHAIITRLQKAEDSRKKFEIHSIIVQSPWLKEALAEILEDYPGVHCGLKRLVFEAPFQPFVHRWRAFEEYRKRKDFDVTTAEHLNLLYNVLREELKDVIKTLEDYVEKGIVTFDHLWTIFQPGTFIFSASHRGAASAMRLNGGQYVELKCGMAYQLSAESVDWNGYFGRSTETINLFEFPGTTNIVGLKAFPFSFHPDRSAVEQELVERGQKFEQLAGCHYKE